MMTRWKASAIHFSICVLIALSVLALMLFIWYPAPYFDSMGGKELLYILLAVDLTLGPLLTLIIYNPQKKSLRFDLSVIAAFQLAALAYGMSVLYQARPVYLVFTVDRFEVVTANELDPESLGKVSSDQFRHVPLLGPQVATAILPSDPVMREKILFSALQGGPDVQAMPEFYVDYEQTSADVLQRVMPLVRLEVADELSQQFDRVLNSNELTREQVGLLPVRAKNKFITALVDKNNADVIELVDIDPYTL